MRTGTNSAWSLTSSLIVDATTLGSDVPGGLFFSPVSAPLLVSTIKVGSVLQFPEKGGGSPLICPLLVVCDVVG
jgi:hypothetical protein